MNIGGKPEITNNRIDWIDFAKGIAICLVIAGHTVRPWEPIGEHIVRGIIFSFHMPLFFTLSCITTKLSQNEEQFVRRAEKSFKRLIVPTIFVFFLIKTVEVLRFGIDGGKRSYLANIINTLVYASGVSVPSVNAPALGKLWFLVALFLARTLTDWLFLRLGNKKAILVSFVLSLMGVCFAKVQWLPLSFDTVLAVLPFLSFGYYYKRFIADSPAIWKLLASLFVWSITFVLIFKKSAHYLELATRDYPLFPLCYICACSGIIFVSILSKYMVKVPGSGLIKYIGKNSMDVFLVHVVDDWFFSIWGGVFSSTAGIACTRIVLDVFIARIVIFLKPKAKSLFETIRYNRVRESSK